MHKLHCDCTIIAQIESCRKCRITYYKLPIKNDRQTTETTERYVDKYYQYDKERII